MPSFRSDPATRRASINKNCIFVQSLEMPSTCDPCSTTISSSQIIHSSTTKPPSFMSVIVNSLSIQLDAPAVFLYPNSEKRHAHLTGTIELAVAHTKTFGALSITLTRDTAISVPTQASRRESIGEALQIYNLGRLSRGIHRFPFVLDLPSNISSSMSNHHGATTYRVKAFIKGGSTITRGDLIAQERVQIIANFSEEGELPPPLFEARSGYVDHLGMMRFVVASEAPRLASNLDFALQITPLRSSIIQRISITLVESYTHFQSRIKSEKHEKVQVQQLPPKHIALYDTMPVISEDGALLDDETEYHFTKSLQLPGCNRASATTPSSTRANLRVSHRLVVKLHWRHAVSEAAETFSAELCSLPIDLSSCQANEAHLLLPAYSLNDPNPLTISDLPNVKSCSCSTDAIQDITTALRRSSVSTIASDEVDYVSLLHCKSSRARTPAWVKN